ncbi:hypothetical protein F5887DRAFT_1291426 [Amanita rubescens]|nr:hypothetical protein F5887DRAFT_1291426 [Amanita rubescens]
MASSSSSTPTAPTKLAQSTCTVVYKGKFTRSWPQLPDELVRHIATFYLWDASVTSYCPQVWDTRELWQHRMLYASVRDAIHLEKNLMSICPQWSKALETHLFWHHAIALVDPLDCLAHNAIIQPSKPHLPSDTSPSSTADTHIQEQPIRLTPYCHYRNILTYSCLVCRINQPNSSVGLTLAKRLIPSPLLGSIALCREHDRRRISFCGICMREAPLFEGNAIPPSYAIAGLNPNTALAAQAYNAMSLESIVSCLENEDDDTWPGVAATCRFCRREWLWRKVAGNSRDREAIGGSKLASEDWETRQCVEGFIDLAEGSINDVIGLAREKWWLRKHTRLGDMMLQALAAARFTSANAAVAAAGGRRGGVGEDRVYAAELEEEEEEEEEDDEEDPELMQLTEEGGVRDLALGDWARSRILDGYWISPADLWYHNVVPGKPLTVSAVHPCPWAREDLGLDASDAAEEHPRPSTFNAEMPPSFTLCEQAYISHQRQMRVVLLPPMKNVVRRLVIECLEDGKTSSKGDCTWGGTSDDPAMRASKMNLEEVLRILREEEGVWFDGVDWAERRRNNARDRMAIEDKDRKACEMSTNSPTSTTGSSSTSDSKSGASSSATSPVLSTSTLQTTPSPSPISSSSPSLDVTPREGDDCLEESVMPISDSSVPVQKAKPVAPPLPPRPSTQLITIAISPILNPPRLLRPIPYVPVTSAHLPSYSLEAFRAVSEGFAFVVWVHAIYICVRACMLHASAAHIIWRVVCAWLLARDACSAPLTYDQELITVYPQVWREACAPLYHCRCKICERAMAKANADAAAANAQTNGSVPVSQAQDVRSSPQIPNQGLKKPVEIRLDDATEADGEGEEEVEHVREGEEEEVEYEQEYEEEEEEDLEVSSTFGEYGGERGSYSPSSFSRVATPEIVLDGEDDPENDPLEGHFQKRRSKAESNSDDEFEPLPPARRSRKRSCDELEEDVQELRRKKEGTPPKRARKGDGTMDPRPAATLAVGGRTNRMRKRNSEELRDDDDDDTRGESTIRTNAARRGRGNTSSDERSGDTTSPHKRLKMGDAGRDHRGRDGGGKSRVLR